MTSFLSWNFAMKIQDCWNKIGYYQHTMVYQLTPAFLLNLENRMHSQIPLCLSILLETKLELCSSGLKVQYLPGCQLDLDSPWFVWHCQLNMQHLLTQSGRPELCQPDLREWLPKGCHSGLDSLQSVQHSQRSTWHLWTQSGRLEQCQPDFRVQWLPGWHFELDQLQFAQNYQQLHHWLMEQLEHLQSLWWLEDLFLWQLGVHHQVKNRMNCQGLLLGFESMLWLLLDLKVAQSLYLILDSQLGWIGLVQPQSDFAPHMIGWGLGSFPCLQYFAGFDFRKRQIGSTEYLLDSEQWFVGMQYSIGQCYHLLDFRRHLIGLQKHWTGCYPHLIGWEMQWLGCMRHLIGQWHQQSDFQQLTPVMCQMSFGLQQHQFDYWDFVELLKFDLQMQHFL